jgi:hypothetical protein
MKIEEQLLNNKMIICGRVNSCKDHKELEELLILLADLVKTERNMNKFLNEE